jgi:hypothetical protein
VGAAPCSVSVCRSNLLGLVSACQRFSLIYAWLGPSNGLNVPVVHWMLSSNLDRDVSGDRLLAGL